jgi:hypothetical protein
MLGKKALAGMAVMAAAVFVLLVFGGLPMAEGVAMQVGDGLVLAGPDKDCANLESTCKGWCRGLKADGYSLVVDFSLKGSECFNDAVCRETPHTVQIKSCTIVKDGETVKDVICTCEWYTKETGVKEWTPEICGDGLDNDLDGLPDCGDPSCCTAPACSIGDICAAAD